MTGNPNFHLDNKSGVDAGIFCGIWGSRSLKQHVTCLTHKRHQSLDMVISSEPSSTAVGIVIVCDPCLSNKGQPSVDRFAVQFLVNMDKPGRQQSNIKTFKRNSLPSQVLNDPIEKG